MSTPFQPPVLGPTLGDLRQLHRCWCWFLTLGSLLIIVGMFAIAYPVAATLTTLEIFGYLLLFGGVLEIINGIYAIRRGGFFIHLMCGLLYMLLGGIIVEHPGMSAEIYTLIMAIFFVALGAGRIGFALSNQFPGKGWTLLNGVITLILGIMIWRRLPASALWVIGTFVGIELIFNGWSWVMLGLAAKSVPPEEAART